MSNSEVKKDSHPLENFAIATHQTMICKVSKYFEFKNCRFPMTSRHPLSVRKAERRGWILEFMRIRGHWQRHSSSQLEFNECTVRTPSMGSRPIVDGNEFHRLHSYCHPRFEGWPHHVQQPYTVVCIQQFFHCELHSESGVIQSVCFRSTSWKACYLELFPSL